MEWGMSSVSMAPEWLRWFYPLSIDPDTDGALASRRRGYESALDEWPEVYPFAFNCGEVWHRNLYFVGYRQAVAWLACVEGAD